MFSGLVCFGEFFLLICLHKPVILQLLLFISSCGYGVRTQMWRCKSQIKLLLFCISSPSQLNPSTHSQRMAREWLIHPASCPTYFRNVLMLALCPLMPALQTVLLVLYHHHLSSSIMCNKTFRPVMCWVDESPAVRMLLGWKGASSEICCGCGNNHLLVGCSLKKLVYMYMKEQEPLPKQVKILVQRIFQVEECCYPTHFGLYSLVSWHVWAHVENRMIISN